MHHTFRYFLSKTIIKYTIYSRQNTYYDQRDQEQKSHQMIYENGWSLSNDENYLHYETWNEQVYCELQLLMVYLVHQSTDYTDCLMKDDPVVITMHVFLVLSFHPAQLQNVSRDQMLIQTAFPVPVMNFDYLDGVKGCAGRGLKLTIVVLIQKSILAFQKLELMTLMNGNGCVH